MLIEVRIGPGKRKLTESILRVNRLSGTTPDKIHRVPHISLYGSFAADNKQTERIKEVLASVGRRYSFLPYLIDGFHWIKGKHGRVIYFNIVASPEFKRFRQELAQRLLGIAPRTQHYDQEEDFLFHATLAYKLDSREFERIWSQVSQDQTLSGKFIAHTGDSEQHQMKYFYLPLNALRATFLNDQSKIVCEYDFLQQRLLTRSEAVSVNEWSRTLYLFRIRKGIENGGYEAAPPSPYVASDLHLDHTSIIDYCARPFNPANIEEMNNLLIENWNSSVGDNDIYYLGDLSYGKEARPPDYWLGKLSGRKHLVRGCHDGNIEGAGDHEVLKYGRYNFLLVHDPDKLPIEWNGWVIHGHKHNNDLKNYPFVNGDRRTINVCPEVTNYRPVSLDYLTSLKLSAIRRMDTIDSLPVMR